MTILVQLAIVNALKGSGNCNIEIRAQFRILKCYAIVKEAIRKVLKHVY